MFQQSSRSPTLSAILIGILIFLALLVMYFFLPSLVKWIGYPFQLIPSWLGLVERVKPNEVMPVDMNDSPSMVHIDEPGGYLFYTNDLDLLTITDQLMAGSGHPWVDITCVETGEELQPQYVDRGMAFYDTPFAPGRPVYSLVFPQAGDYIFVHPQKYTVAAFTPDNLTGREGLFTTLMLLQLALIATPFAYRWYRVNSKRWEVERTLRDQNRERTERFWRAWRERRRAAAEDKETPPMEVYRDRPATRRKKEW